MKDPAPGTPSIAYPSEVLKAIQQAKEANNNVALAQHKVAEAKQATLFQQKIALAKEAAAREAAARYNMLIIILLDYSFSSLHILLYTLLYIFIYIIYFYILLYIFVYIFIYYRQ